jgi:hypothetical protein
VDADLAGRVPAQRAAVASVGRLLILFRARA